MARTLYRYSSDSTKEFAPRWGAVLESLTRPTQPLKGSRLAVRICALLADRLPQRINWRRSEVDRTCIGCVDLTFLTQKRYATHIIIDGREGLTTVSRLQHPTIFERWTEFSSLGRLRGHIFVRNIPLVVGSMSSRAPPTGTLTSER